MPEKVSRLPIYPGSQATWSSMVVDRPGKLGTQKSWATSFQGHRGPFGALGSRCLRRLGTMAARGLDTWERRGLGIKEIGHHGFRETSFLAKPDGYVPG